MSDANTQQQTKPSPQEAAGNAMLQTLVRQRNAALDEVAQIAAANAGLAAQNEQLREQLAALQSPSTPTEGVTK